MSVFVTERFKSRRRTIEREPKEERLYIIQGTDDENEAGNALDAFLETEFAADDGTMRFQDGTLDRIAPNVFLATANFQLSPNDSDDPSSTGPDIDFELGGSTVKKYVSYSVASSYKSGGGAAPDALGTIGADGDGNVEGCDVFTPSAVWSESWTVPTANLTDAYLDGLFQLCATPVNNATFRRKPAGSVLLMGISGSKKSPQSMTLAFKFGYQPNLTGLTIGDISGITKDGWDYADVRFKTSTGGGFSIQVPQLVYIHRVYQRGDFSIMGIGT